MFFVDISWTDVSCRTRNIRKDQLYFILFIMPKDLYITEQLPYDFS